jgi:DNA (cytosine-5)-methyltransferase 1
MTLTLTDLFCEAGGSSSGAERVAGVKVVMAANHWRLAIDTHNTNLPGADHDCADISQVDPRRYPPTDLLWASPECTNHSQARGKRKADKQPDLFGETLPDAAAERSRATMFDVCRFVEAGILRGRPYKAFVVENVVEVRDWMFYEPWLTALRNAGPGYCLHIVYLNSMFAQNGGLGAPQSRDRWFCVGHLTSIRCPDLHKWTRPVTTCHSCGNRVRPVQAWKNIKRQFGKYGTQYVWRCPTTACKGQEVHPQVLPAAAAINWAMPGRRIGDRRRPLRPKTMARIEAGLRRYATTPQLVPAGGGWNTTTTPVTDPMRARTTRETEGLLAGPGGLYAPGFLTLLRSGRARTIGVDEPLATIVADGSNHALVQPLVVALEGRADTNRVRSVSEPLRTQTGRHLDALVVPLRNNGVAKTLDLPLDTVAAGGNHHGLLTGPNLLIPYHRTGVARPVDEPMGTLTTVDRLGLLNADGQPIDAMDCLFRMLEPAEIKIGMGFTNGYTLLGNRRAQVRQAGNAVTPCAARDLIAAVVEAITGQEPVILADDRDMLNTWWNDSFDLDAWAADALVTAN